jgi:hypothetical protein
LDRDRVGDKFHHRYRHADETITASHVNYNPGEITTTGTITVTGTEVTLSGSPQTVVAGTAGSGNNSASWDPGLVVSAPPPRASLTHDLLPVSVLVLGPH